jgi:hypothetical protein
METVMKRYTIDATFPMEDGSLGDMAFSIEAENIQEAVKTATTTVEALDALDLTIWSVCEAENA